MAKEESLTGMKKAVFEPALSKDVVRKSNSFVKKDCLSDFRDFLNGPHPKAFQESRLPAFGVANGNYLLSPQEKISLKEAAKSKNNKPARIFQPLRLKSLEVDVEHNQIYEKEKPKTVSKEAMKTELVFIQKRVEDLDSTESEKQKSYDGIIMDDAKTVNTEIEAFDYNDADVLMRLRMHSSEEEFNQDIFQEVQSEAGESMIFNPYRGKSLDQKVKGRKSNFSHVNAFADKKDKLLSPKDKSNNDNSNFSTTLQE
jgi:hypothetical protein